MADRNQTVTDQQRQQLEDDLAASLLLLYHGHRATALAALGVAASDPTPAAVQKVSAFAADRAQKIQDGINSRMSGASDSAAMAAGIADYNATVLQPFMESWAEHQGTIDAYQETPSADGSGSAADSTLWTWSQQTAFEDDCTEADGMSPASLDDLFSVTGGPPPVHERCQCLLSPIG